MVSSTILSSFDCERILTLGLLALFHLNVLVRLRRAALNLDSGVYSRNELMARLWLLIPLFFQWNRRKLYLLLR